MKIDNLIAVTAVKCALLIGGLFIGFQPSATGLTLEEAVALAHQNDPWLRADHLKQQALRAQSDAVDTLPDPMLSLGILNLPTNSFTLNQEPMSQIKLGVTQAFPRGDSRGIERKQLELLARQHPYLREDRRAQVKVTVAQLWLDAYSAQQSIKLLAQERSLFEQLSQFVQASYSSAQGKTRQQDLLRAQLEISALEDRLVNLQQKQDRAMAEIMKWLNIDYQSAPPLARDVELVLNEQPPPSKLFPKAWPLLENISQRQRLVDVLAAHPAVLAFDQRIAASYTGVKLAKQKYAAQWAVNAGYAYRADDQLGGNRADLLSLGVSVEMPLFGTTRQDKQVQSSKLNAEALKTEKRLLLRNMLAELDGSYRQYQRLAQRSSLFSDSILPQMHELAEASLTAYTNYDGDFTEVIRARIAEFNGRMEQISIRTERLKTQAHISYFFTNAKTLDAQIQGADK